MSCAPKGPSTSYDRFATRLLSRPMPGKERRLSRAPFIHTWRIWEHLGPQKWPSLRHHLSTPKVASIQARSRLYPKLEALGFDEGFRGSRIEFKYCSFVSGSPIMRKEYEQVEIKSTTFAILKILKARYILRKGGRREVSSRTIEPRAPRGRRC